MRAATLLLLLVVPACRTNLLDGAMPSAAPAPRCVPFSPDALRFIGVDVPITLAFDEYALYVGLSVVAGTPEPAHAIWAIPRDGSARRLITRVSDLSAVVAWRGWLYWLEWDGRVLRARFDGGGTEELARADIQANRLIVDDSGIYIGENRPRKGWARIYHLPLEGGTPTVFAEERYTWVYTIDYSADPIWLALDDDALYWVRRARVGVHGGLDPDGALLRAPKSGGAGTRLLDGLFDVDGLWVSGDTAWLWLGVSWNGHSTDSSFTGLPTRGGTTATIVTLDEAHYYPTEVADGALYYFDRDRTGLVRTLLPGGPPTTSPTVLGKTFVLVADRACGGLYGIILGQMSGEVRRQE